MWLTLKKSQHFEPVCFIEENKIQAFQQKFKHNILSQILNM